MNKRESSASQYSDKWQDMLAVVNQYPEFTQNDLLIQNKKIFLIRLLAENIFIFLLQYTGLMFSTTLSGFHPVWIASGTACAFMFLRGASIMPGIWLGSCLAFYTIMPIHYACAIAAIFTLQPLLLITINFKFLQCPMPNHDNVRSFLNFIFACFFISLFTSLSLASITPSTSTNLVTKTLHWSLANFNGMLIFTCAITTWDAYFSEVTITSKTEKHIATFAYCLLITLIILLCVNNYFWITTWLCISILVVIISISHYSGWCASILSITLLAIITSFFAYIGTPLFIANTHISTIFTLDLLIALSATAGLLSGIRR